MTTAANSGKREEGLAGSAASVLFIDLDATVMTNPFWTAVFPALGEVFQQATGVAPDIIINELVSENRRRLDHPPSDQAVAMDWDDIAQTVARNHNMRLTESVEDLVKRFSGPPYASILDDAPSVLRGLSNGGRRRLVVASMGLAKYQFPVLHSLDLFDCFDDFLMPDLTGFLKTDRRFYSKYLQGNDNVKFVSIGDHYIDDVLCPRSFGFRSVLKANVPEIQALLPFERPTHLGEYRGKVRGLSNNLSVLPDAVILDLSELADVIKQIESS